MRCSAYKSDGTPCRGEAQEGLTTCWSHTPENLAVLREAGRRGGRAGGLGRPSVFVAEIGAVKKTLRGIASAVLSKDPAKRVNRADALAAVQALNGVLRALDIERRVHELDEAELLLEEMAERAKRERAS